MRNKIKAEDEQMIAEEYAKFCKAMTSSDTDHMRTACGKTLPHLTSGEQPIEAWIQDVKSGNIKYYDIKTENVKITLKGDHAIFCCTAVFDASVYGVRESRKIPAKAEFERNGSKWEMVPGTYDFNR